MKRVFGLILIFIAVFTVASCGDEKKSAAPKEKVSKEITAEDGGTISTSDESVAVDIPADALDSDTTITVSVYESSHYPTSKGETVVSTVVEFEPSGTIFKKPVIIRMTTNKAIKNKVVAAAVYNEAKGAWSYNEHGAYAVLAGKDAAGDPIMQSAAGDPIMLNAAGDPIMMSAAGDPIMMAAAGDPIMLASAGDPIMSNAAGDPIMNAAAGDPIMMTTGHFTSYTFIELGEEEEVPVVVPDNDSDDSDDADDVDDVEPDEDTEPAEDVPECGNGVVEKGEECDNGADNGTMFCDYGEESCELCSLSCESIQGNASYCGDGLIDTLNGETCDDGAILNGTYAHCNATCSGPASYCGDGHVDEEEGETCDDGADNDTYGHCNAWCDGPAPYCGDGTKQSNEACDKADPEYGEGEGIGSNCSDDCQTATISCGILPANAEWVNGDTYESTLDGDGSSPSAHYAEAGDCAYKCKATYSWIDSSCTCTDAEHVENGVCTSNTQAAASCGTLPANAEWVSGDTYIPTWNGSAYSSATANYAETGDCAYQCKATYSWVETNGTCACPAEQHVENDVCVSDTGTAKNCTNLPENAAWKVGTYIPHWIDEVWSTEPEATYFEDGGSECTFECVTNYHYEEEICQSDTKPAESCGDLPENAQWVEGGTYIPTWNGKGYPYYTAHYAEEGDCAFVCLEDYEWNEDTVKCSAPVVKVLCTGQTKCYGDEDYSVIDCPEEGEALYGQDANYAARQSCTPQAYEKIEEGDVNIVDDLVTGLRWYISPEGGTWNNAVAFCDSIDTEDGREWRLPTAKELMSIIDSGSSYPAVRDAYFRSVFSSYNSYWSANYFLNSKTGEDEVLIMDVGYGHLKYDSYGKEEGNNNFACVSGEEYGVAGTFTTQNISGNSVVTDSATDLMWTAATQNDLSWQRALDYCENLNYAGYTDWRLPNRNEFATILDYSSFTSKSSFPNINAINYWTSTSAVTYGGSSGAFIIDVAGGTMFAVGETGVTSAAVLCIRNDDIAEYQAVPACDESGYTPCEDAETGIVWSQDVNDSDDEVDYLEAAMMCRESKQGGISQWRVATISEIRTILRSDGLDECYVSDECSEISSEVCYDSEICETGTAIESAFHDYTFMVSGTQTGEGEGYSWRVNFQTGAIESHHGEYIYVTPSIRCVKDNSIPNVEFPYTDDENSLVWSELSADQLSWSEASEYCTTDEQYAWRLPTIEELATLVQGCHDGNCAPDIAGGYSVFGDVSILWSSTLTENPTPTYVERYYNALDFMTASQKALLENEIQNYTAKVRCVADVDENPSPCDLYPCEDIENSDGTCSETLDGGYICGCVEGYEWDGEECWATEPDFPECSPESEFPCIDSEYELVWSSLAADTMTWDDAGSYCENLEEGGYDDWRLPTIDELRTVIQNCPGSQSGGACAISDPDHLSNSDFSNDCYCDSMGNNNGYYSRLGDDDLVSLWSSSTTSGNTDRAWRVGFDDAYVYGYNKSGNNNVRCVR